MIPVKSLFGIRQNKKLYIYICSFWRLLSVEECSAISIYPLEKSGFVKRVCTGDLDDTFAHV